MKINADLIYIIESIKSYLKLILILGVILLFWSFIVLNKPTGKSSYLYGIVLEIRTSSNTVEYSAGGFISGYARVALENGVEI